MRRMLRYMHLGESRSVLPGSFISMMMLIYDARVSGLKRIEFCGLVSVGSRRQHRRRIIYAYPVSHSEHERTIETEEVERGRHGNTIWDRLMKYQCGNKEGIGTRDEKRLEISTKRASLTSDG